MLLLFRLFYPFLVVYLGYQTSVKVRDCISGFGGGVKTLDAPQARVVVEFKVEKSTEVESFNDIRTSSSEAWETGQDGGTKLGDNDETTGGINWVGMKAEVEDELKTDDWFNSMFTEEHLEFDIIDPMTPRATSTITVTRVLERTTTVTMKPAATWVTQPYVAPKPIQEKWSFDSPHILLIKALLWFVGYIWKICKLIVTSIPEIIHFIYKVFIKVWYFDLDQVKLLNVISRASKVIWNDLLGGTCGKFLTIILVMILYLLNVSSGYGHRALIGLINLSIAYINGNPSRDDEEPSGAGPGVEDINSETSITLEDLEFLNDLFDLEDHWRIGSTIPGDIIPNVSVVPPPIEGVHPSPEDHASAPMHPPIIVEPEVIGLTTPIDSATTVPINKFNEALNSMDEIRKSRNHLSHTILRLREKICGIQREVKTCEGKLIVAEERAKMAEDGERVAERKMDDSKVNENWAIKEKERIVKYQSRLTSEVEDLKMKLASAEEIVEEGQSRLVAANNAAAAHQATINELNSRHSTLRRCIDGLYTSYDELEFKLEREWNARFHDFKIQIETAAEEKTSQLSRSHFLHSRRSEEEVERAQSSEKRMLEQLTKEKEDFRCSSSLEISRLTREKTEFAKYEKDQRAEIDSLRRNTEETVEAMKATAASQIEAELVRAELREAMIRVVAASERNPPATSSTSDILAVVESGHNKADAGVTTDADAATKGVQTETDAYADAGSLLVIATETSFVAPSEVIEPTTPELTKVHRCAPFERSNTSQESISAGDLPFSKSSTELALIPTSDSAPPPVWDYYNHLSAKSLRIVGEAENKVTVLESMRKDELIAEAYRLTIDVGRVYPTLRNDILAKATTAAVLTDEKELGQAIWSCSVNNDAKQYPAAVVAAFSDNEVIKSSVQFGFGSPATPAELITARHFLVKGHPEAVRTRTTAAFSFGLFSEPFNASQHGYPGWVGRPSPYAQQSASQFYIPSQPQEVLPVYTPSHVGSYQPWIAVSPLPNAFATSEIQQLGAIGPNEMPIMSSTRSYQVEHPGLQQVSVAPTELLLATASSPVPVAQTFGPPGFAENLWIPAFRAAPTSSLATLSHTTILGPSTSSPVPHYQQVAPATVRPYRTEVELRAALVASRNLKESQVAQNSFFTPAGTPLGASPIYENSPLTPFTEPPPHTLEKALAAIRVPAVGTASEIKASSLLSRLGPKVVDIPSAPYLNKGAPFNSPAGQFRARCTPVSTSSTSFPHDYKTATAVPTQTQILQPVNLQLRPLVPAAAAPRMTHKERMESVKRSEAPTKKGVERMILFGSKPGAEVAPG